MKELGIVDVLVKGLPAKRYIKIYEDAILKLLNTKEVVEEEPIEKDKVVVEEKKISKRLSRKDQLTEYISTLDFCDNTKDKLFKWIFNIGLPKGITLEQLKDKLKNLDEECNGDENTMCLSIENAYLNNYFGFFKPKNISNNNKITTTNVVEDYNTQLTGKNRYVAVANDIVF